MVLVMAVLPQVAVLFPQLHAYLRLWNC